MRRRRVEIKSRPEQTVSWRSVFYFSFFSWILSIFGSVFYGYKSFSENTKKKEEDLKIISRKDWGADESLLFWENDPIIVERSGEIYEEYPEELKVSKRIFEIDGKNLKVAKDFAPDVKRIVIHHSTGTSQEFATDALVREYLQKLLKFRTNASEENRNNLTGDVPYHYFIDPRGNIYEGVRGGDKIIASHVAGANTGSLGIAVLGNFETDEISDEAYKSLLKLVQKKAEEYKINPSEKQTFLGNQIENVSGHKDYINFSTDGTRQITDCPGHNLYDKLDDIRKKTSVNFSKTKQNKDIFFFSATVFVLAFGIMLFSREKAINQKKS